LSGTTVEELNGYIAPFRDDVVAAFLPVISQWVPELALASNDGFYHPDSSIQSNGHGGGYTLNGSKRYLYDENGLEPQQVIEKGLYMALMYNKMKQIISSTDETLSHRLLALMGANPNFNNSANGQNADRLGANYIARRDQNDGLGLYSQNRRILTALQIAAKTASPIAASQAANEFLLAYEKGIAATIINYLHQTNAFISVTSPTDDDLSAALHAYSEAVGFTIGHIGLETTLGDDRMAQILALLNYNNGPDSETYLVATDRFNTVEKNNQAIELLKEVYSFSDAEIESFRFNWVAEQGR
jgi:hypothetical protein